MTRIGEELSLFNNIYHMKVTHNTTTSDADVGDRARALLEQEGDLSDEAMLTIIDLFKENVENARIYLGFKRGSLRKRWVRRELAKLNFVFDDEPNEEPDV
jgi:hypothetical protein